MFKKYIQKLVPAVLLTLLVFSLVFPLVALADSTGTETRALVVDFELNECTVELWYYNDAGTLESKSSLEDGVIQRIPYGKKNVEVKVIPSPGYALDSIYQIKADGTKEGPWNKWSTPQFNNDITLEILCKPKTFRVVFVAEADQPIDSYQFPSDVAEKYQDLQFTYLGGDIVIDPVVKTSGGYTFKGWEMVYEEEGVGTIAKPLPKDSDGNWIISSTIMIQDEWQTEGEIYLRPAFTPNLYPVWWYDYELTVPGDYDSVALLKDSYQTMESMGTNVDGTVNSDIYPGYFFDKFVSYPVDVDDSEGGSAKKNKVHRYFNPIVYNLTYEYTPGTLTLPDGSTAASTHVYNQDTPLPTATRKGYTFGGWEVLVNGKVVDVISDPDAMYLEKRNTAYAIDNSDNSITLRALWVSNRYAVEYDLGGADAADNTMLPDEYVYDTALTVPTPLRKGYRFVGWVINGDTDGMWKPTSDKPQLILGAETYTDPLKLTAVWKALEFNVVLDSNGGLPEAGSVLPKGATYDQPLDTTGITLPSYSQYRFLGFYYGDVCYINADGSSACAAWDLISEDGTPIVVLTAKWELLPALDVDTKSFLLDYKNEKFKFPQGKYKVSLGDVTVEFTVDADGMGNGKIPESFFGKTVELTVCTTDGTLYSDYHGTLAIEARPVAPTRENGVIDQVFSANTTIQIYFKEGIDVSLYEAALYLDGKTVVSWNDSMVFENLKEGTSYVVLVRVKATDTAPCSLSTQFERDTDSKGFKNSLYQKLDELIQDGDGDMVHSLIAEAKNDIAELKHSTTFYEDANKIVEDAAEAVKFARRQDQKITALRNYRDALLGTKAYSQTNQALIEKYFTNAEKDIQNATDDATINAVYDAAYEGMSEVKITYLQSGDVFLTSKDGLHKDITITLVRHPDFTTQAEQVNNAISVGKVLSVGDMSPQELIKILKTQDVMAAYTMSLSATDYTGSFKVTMRLPEELRGVSGLRVAYFDRTTGSLQILATESEGDYLVFYADQIADFVILGDPTLNVTLPMIALAIVVICQLIAIVLLLKSRSDSKKAVRNYSVALPMALTIQFFPRFGALAVLILGALVIILQIILTVLLLRSEVIPKSRLKRRPPVAEPEEEIPAMADADGAFEEVFPAVPLDGYEESSVADGEEAPVQETYEASAETYYAFDDDYAETVPEEYAETEEEPFYYASENTENNAEGVDEDVFVDSASYEFDNYYEEELQDAEVDDEIAEVTEEAAPEETEISIVSEDEEENGYFFEEDIAYGDPAEPPLDNEPLEDESKNG